MSQIMGGLQDMDRGICIYILNSKVSWSHGEHFPHLTISAYPSNNRPYLLIELFIYKESLFIILQFLNPLAIELRMRRMQSKKGEYIIPGPDWIQLINRHDKLSPFNIKIYAYINAYSRNIIWVYVRISNQTSYLIVQQYLIVCA